MTVYTLLNNVTAVQSAPGVGSPPANVVQPVAGDGVRSPPPEQTFQLNVSSPYGNVSASAQIVASNDGVNWIAYGSAISAPSAYLNSTAGGSGNACYTYFGAYITAISGQSAAASVIMGA